jgi:peptidoglycan hydrolase-like protein with peptidoglycan-binding domain
MLRQRHIFGWFGIIGVLLLGLIAIPRQSFAVVAWPVLNLNAVNEDVYTVQAMLRAAGYAAPFNGVYDSATKTQVANYQSANGLSPVDGITGSATWESLTRQSSSVVRQGDLNNIVVQALQRQLQLNYGYNLTADGDFGSGTYGKVTSFQKSVNLSPVDGIVGRNTWFHIISGDTDRIRHSSALTQLNNAGITVTSSLGSAGVGSDRADSSTTRTSLEQIRQQSVNGLINFKNRLPSTCAVRVTGGTETWIHTSGVKSHHTGYKIDLSPEACVSNYIKANFTKLDATHWQDASGNVYYEEAVGTSNHHWDITFG